MLHLSIMNQQEQEHSMSVRLPQVSAWMEPRSHVTAAVHVRPVQTTTGADDKEKKGPGRAGSNSRSNYDNCSMIYFPCSRGRRRSLAQLASPSVALPSLRRTSRLRRSSTHQLALRFLMVIDGGRDKAKGRRQRQQCVGSIIRFSRK